LVAYDFRAYIWEYSFAVGISKRVTSVPDGNARGITVSPDGTKIIFEHQPSGHWLDANPLYLPTVRRQKHFISGMRLNID
jgi:Tol biopolymer transport system component